METLLSQKLEKFGEIWDFRYHLLRQWKDEGRTVFGYVYSDVPLEIIHAAGILPIQLTESGDTKHHDLGTFESESYFCDHSQSILGQALDGTYAALDGAIFAHSCETLRMLASAWEICMAGRFFYFISPPLKRSDSARRFLTAEYQALQKSTGQFIGREISLTNLSASIEIYNTNRGLVQRLYDLRSERKLKISAAELNTVVKAAWVMPVETHNAMVTGLLSEAITPPPCGEDSKLRIMISGFLPEQYMIPGLNIAEIIEKESGEEVIIDDHVHGHRYSLLPIRTDMNPLDALVDRYLGSIPVSFRQTSDQEVIRLLTVAKNHKADGVIILAPKFCTDFLFQLPYIVSEFGLSKIPVLTIETVEQVQLGQLRNRLDAFMEMLKNE